MSFKSKKKSGKIKNPGLTDKEEKRIYSNVKNSMLSCTDAFLLSDELGVSKKQIGMFADFNEIRLIDCQLGLFGSGPGQNKKVKKIDIVQEQLKKNILSSLTENKLSCRDAWRISSEMNISKMEVSDACETMNIKIIQCRLGAF